MVSEIKYRYDFIGLSTDDKPTPATSNEVVDGSTFYESNTSKLYVWYKNQWYEKEAQGGGGATYTAGDNIQISSDNVISATDTTYSAFTGTDGTAAGTSGLVPAPATTDAGKFLKADGTWDSAGGSSVNVVQTTGSSTTDVMSQKATTDMVLDPLHTQSVCIGGSGTYSTNYSVSVRGRISNNSTSCVAVGNSAYIGADGQATNCIAIGDSSNINYGQGSVAIGDSSAVYSFDATNRSVALGSHAKVLGTSDNHINYSVALGAYSAPNVSGQVDISTGAQNYGYNGTGYRLLSGVHDGQSAHDAATVAQGNTLATSAPTTSTVGVLGQLYTDTTNMHTYQCTAISGDTYTWTQRW